MNYLLTEQDRAIVQEVIRALRDARLIGPNRSDRPALDVPTTQSYMVKTPAEGLPAVDADDPAQVQPGKARCQVYRQVLVDDEDVDGGTYLKDAGFDLEVFNATDTALPGDAFVRVVRDKFGQWYAESSATGSGGAVDCAQVCDCVPQPITNVCPTKQTIGFSQDPETGEFLGFTVNGSSPQASVRLVSSIKVETTDCETGAKTCRTDPPDCCTDPANIGEPVQTACRARPVPRILYATFPDIPACPQLTGLLVRLVYEAAGCDGLGGYPWTSHGNFEDWPLIQAHVEGNTLTIDGMLLGCGGGDVFDVAFTSLGNGPCSGDPGLIEVNSAILTSADPLQITVNVTIHDNDEDICEGTFDVIITE